MLEIRSAEFDDARALAAIDLATWSPRVTPAPPRDPDLPFFRQRADPADVLVAQGDGEVLGYVMLRQSFPLPSHAHALEVSGLAVDPKHQGRGVGRFLVEEAKTQAQRRRVRKLSLRVLSPNGSARRLYESSGFVIEGVLRGEFLLEGHFVDDVLMACYLDGNQPAPR